MLPKTINSFGHPEPCRSLPIPDIIIPSSSSSGMGAGRSPTIILKVAAIWFASGNFCRITE